MESLGKIKYKKEKLILGPGLNNAVTGIFKPCCLLEAPTINIILHKPVAQYRRLADARGRS